MDTLIFLAAIAALGVVIARYLQRSSRKQDLKKNEEARNAYRSARLKTSGSSGFSRDRSPGLHGTYRTPPASIHSLDKREEEGPREIVYDGYSRRDRHTHELQTGQGRAESSR